MKQYLLSRLKKRWMIIPVAAILALFTALRSIYVFHDGKAMRNVLFFFGFAAIGVLFPFRWGGED